MGGEYFSPLGTGAPVTPPALKELYASWFARADADGDGRVTGADAVKFFARSGLPRELLARVWAAADAGRRGYLDAPAFALAMQLVALGQATGEVSAAGLAARAAAGPPLGPPAMAGLPAPAAAAASPSNNPFAPGGEPSPGGSAGGAPPPPAWAPAAAPAAPAFPAAARGGRPITAKDVTSVCDGLRRIYFSKIRPLEEASRFGHFFSPLLSEGDFAAKPSVLLLGQYSTGKSTFIKYLLGREYPGAHIGPEPTTDRFVVVQHGPDDRRTPGNALVVQPDQPYGSLAALGNGFLSKLEAAACDNRLLEEVTLVDTPGVLSGEKQRVARAYDFVAACAWFAARADLVLLLFDPHKLDVSDEFKAVIAALRGHEDKVRVVLNKADAVDAQQLMRVYGALMWSLGRVFGTPEVARVYVGSFAPAGGPPRRGANPAAAPLFEREQEDLLHDLYGVPARAADRRVAEFAKRLRAVRTHLLIVGRLRRQLPFFSSKKAQERLRENLAAEFDAVRREHHLAAGDFPDPGRYAEILAGFDLSTFPKLDKAALKAVDDALAVDVPALVRAMGNPF